MYLYFATTNEGKLKSIRREMLNYQYEVVQQPLKFKESRSDDIKEIAAAKVNSAFSKTRQPTFVIDSSLYINSLNGFPLTHVNFILDTLGLEGILKLVDDKSRTCTITECLAYRDKFNASPKYFFANVNGTIADSPRGTLQEHHWSKLDLIFIPDGNIKTLGEMSPTEYDQIMLATEKTSSLGKQLYRWLLSRE